MADAVAEPPQQVTPAQFDQSPFSSPEFMKGLNEAGFQDSSVETLEPATPPQAATTAKAADVKVDAKTATTPDPKVDEAKAAADAKIAADLDLDHPDSPLPPDIQRASQKTQSSFKALKAASHARKLELDKIRPDYEKVRSESETIKKELTALKAAPQSKEINLAENSEYKRIKTEYEEAVNKIRELDVTHDKQFRAFFDGKKSQQIEIAKRAAGDRAEAVLTLPPGAYRDEQVELLVAELSPAKGMQLVNAKTALESIEMERDSAIKTEASRYEQRQMERAAQEKERQGTIETAFSTTLESVAKENPMYQEREGDDEWNKGVAESKLLAKQIYSGKLPPADAALAAVWAARMPLLVKVYQEEKLAWTAKETEHAAKVSELEGEILKLRGATPTPGDGTATATVQASGATGIDAIMAGIKAQGLLNG